VGLDTIKIAKEMAGGPDAPQTLLALRPLEPMTQRRVVTIVSRFFSAYLIQNLYK
jgi:hypothetical protein